MPKIVFHIRSLALPSLYLSTIVNLSAQILRTMYIFTNTLVAKYKSIRNGTKKGANDLKVFNKIKAVPRIIRP